MFRTLLTDQNAHYCKQNLFIFQEKKNAEFTINCLISNIYYAFIFKGKNYEIILNKDFNVISQFVESYGH